MFSTNDKFFSPATFFGPYFIIKHDSVTTENVGHFLNAVPIKNVQTITLQLCNLLIIILYLSLNNY